jgi:hypothetical protein
MAYTLTAALERWPALPAVGDDELLAEPVRARRPSAASVEYKSGDDFFDAMCYERDRFLAERRAHVLSTMRGLLFARAPQCSSPQPLPLRGARPRERRPAARRSSGRRGARTDPDLDPPGAAGLIRLWAA